MPHADVVVIGAGLAGLTAATRLAEAGAAVTLVAKGHASTPLGQRVASTSRRQRAPARPPTGSGCWRPTPITRMRSSVRMPGRR